jgi:sec-independent protein translocase protein TatC
MSMSVIGHLEELRRRTIWCIAYVLLASLISMIFTDKILYILKLPSKNLINNFLILKPAESVTIYLKTALFCGLVVSAPLIFIQLFKFIEPAINESLNGKKFFVLKWTFIASILFISGAVFSYFAVLPKALSFLMFLSQGLSDSTIQIALSAYISFVIALLFCGGIIFQIPLIAFIFTKAGIITPSFLFSKRKEAYFILIVISAIITPTTDAFTMALFAVPMIILYEIGIILSKISYRSQIKIIGEVYGEQNQ